jgi:H+-translocating diphosphatase
MRAVSDPIREGAEGFLRVQYSAIFRMAFALAAVILLSYSLRPDSKSQGGVDKLGSVMLGIISCASFGIGAGCSAAAGYVSMWVSASSNIRVASAARRSYQECLEICFRGGAFSAVLCITLCVFGVSMLYVILSVIFVNSGFLTPSGHPSTLPSLNIFVSLFKTLVDIPIIMVGYGFGASFVALFMQLGGGIYTKAADVGADMVGKIEVQQLTHFVHHSLF